MDIQYPSKVDVVTFPARFPMRRSRVLPRHLRRAGALIRFQEPSQAMNARDTATAMLTVAIPAR